MSLYFLPIDRNLDDGKRPPKGFFWSEECSADKEVIADWLERGYSLGLVCGYRSGNLEVIDFDDASVFPLWLEQINDMNAELREKLVIVATRKGYHVYYRCPINEGNTALAKSEEGMVRVETRGEGGYVQCPNPNVDDYAFEEGSFDDIATISPTDRDDLLSTCRSYNRHLRAEYVPDVTINGGRPGDDFNAKMAWSDVLEPLGWSIVRERSGVVEWRRPHKQYGISATTGIHGTDLLYVFTSSVAGLEPNRGYTKFSVHTICNYGGDFQRAASDAAKQGFGNPIQAGGGEASQLGTLLSLAKEDSYFTNQYGEPYICTEGSAVYLGSEQFYHHLDSLYVAESGKVAKESVLGEAVKKLSRYAVIAGVQRDIAMRVGFSDATVYVDIGGRTNERVVIDSNGWRIREGDVGIPFQRSARVGALPEPVAGGHLDQLRPFINVPDDSQWILLVSWLVNCFNPFGTFPIMIIQGEAGSAKSSATRVLRQVVDPSLPMFLNYPKDTEAIFNHAYHNFLLAYDNLSGISNDVSDALCTVASGSGFATRKLYTNMEQVAFQFKRPIVLNGIDNLARRNDFASRSLSLHFQRIEPSDRLTDRHLEESLNSVLPSVLGHLYDAVTCALQNYDNDSFDGSFRMADFVAFATAAAPVLGWGEEDFLQAMKDNQSRLNASMIDNDLVASTVAQYMTDKEEISGYANEILEKVEQLLPTSTRRNRDWPTTPSWFGKRLLRAAPVLREMGITVENERTRNGSVYTIKNGEAL